VGDGKYSIARVGDLGDNNAGVFIDPSIILLQEHFREMIEFGYRLR
jgi:hypothetical protein